MFGWIDDVCVSACLCVCVSVCLLQLYSLNGWVDLETKFTHILFGHEPVKFFSNFGNLNLMSSWRTFGTFRMRHTHGRKFGQIFLKLKYAVAEDHIVFAIENKLTYYI